MISVEMQIEVNLGYSQNIDYVLTSIQRAGSTRTVILYMVPRPMIQTLKCICVVGTVQSYNVNGFHGSCLCVSISLV